MGGALAAFFRNSSQSDAADDGGVERVPLLDSADLGPERLRADVA